MMLDIEGLQELHRKQAGEEVVHIAVPEETPVAESVALVPEGFLEAPKESWLGNLINELKA